MRLGLVVFLCLLNAGCAILRKDKEEPVDNGPGEARAEEVLKPSEALKPASLQLASPVSDRFYMRGTYFQGDVATLIRIDSTGSTTADGTELSGEEDLGLDDVVDQARIEFNVRMAERSNVRIDYFKLNRFSQVTLAEDIEFGDFSFDAGDQFRSKIDFRDLSLSYTYSLFKGEKIEAGLGFGLHIFEIQADGGEPGTLSREQDSEAGIFPTAAVNFAYRISKRWAVTARYNGLTVSDDDGEGAYSDAHADIQYRWRKNFAIGIGYTAINLEIELSDVDEPFMFNLDTKGPELFFRASF